MAGTSPAMTVGSRRGYPTSTPFPTPSGCFMLSLKETAWTPSTIP
jgi:hypothetical protein